MLRLPILLSGLLLASGTDSVWWRTDGGDVSEHHDGSTITCTLQIYNSNGQFSLVWDNTLPTRVVVERHGWKFTPEQITSVALRLGPTWLEGGNGDPNISAMTGSSTFMLVLNQPIDTLLVAANEIVLKTPEAGFGITLIRSKMRALITALNKCRKGIGREQS